MYFGLHSLLFKETFVEEDLPLLERCKSIGFDAVKIIPFEPDKFPAAKVKRVADDLGLTVNTGYGSRWNVTRSALTGDQKGWRRTFQETD